MNRLLKHLPDIFHEIKEFIYLTEAVVPEINDLEQKVNQLLDDQFIMTASERGISRREKMLDIQPDLTIESLEFRRKRLINRKSTKAPFTIRFLQNRLDFLYGVDKAKADIPEDFLLTIETNVKDAAIFREVVQMINAIKPANMVYQHKITLVDVIQLSGLLEADEALRLTKLSTTWELGEVPFVQKGAVIMKGGNQLIEQDLMNLLTNYTSGLIGKVMLNSNVPIEIFDKRIERNKIILESLVPVGLVSEITKVQATNSAGLPLSTHSVSIPITADTILTQEIHFERA
ncbi:putative phage tail protein [Brevibacillus laterosporus]|uniref:putative phage tail protein n=1 Tax=Brevibacillus laterosporus TaxID=1465 RepID=UPI0003B19F72|nr:putative phage tail protein [Brevibacillus laterosporus]ERM20356.1 hypothetical protein P615_00175 [Brevibacillus laterosporus PE36]